MSRKSPISWAIGGLLALGVALPAVAQDYFYRLNVAPTSNEASPVVLISGTGSGFSVDGGGANSGTLQNGSSQTFTFRNDDAGSVQIASVSLSNTTNFEITSDTCGGTTMTSGATCTVSVIFKATTNGTFTGVLSLNVV